MSKYVKDLVTKDLARRLDGVADCVVANVIGLDSLATYQLRKRLREKNIHCLVVKRTLARRATAGTSLAPAFEDLEGSAAVLWGSEDFISLAKEITELDSGTEFKEFATVGGVMDGERLSAERVKEISKWPSRAEQLSLLVGQILGPGASLAGQLVGPGGTLASQIEKKSEGEGAE
ncbi:MAG TPA: 50S ribosomal protein L10 [Planctomycetaceae bacterium]|nr:50S ribosomal protein L10 [Planctomycetaceae bacterium]HRF01441.1 50S ribosomal protein L10 [Pirellulaceae bacterium]